MYEYPTRVVDVIDGDTIDFEVDLGFKIHRTIRVRLLGVDTAEIYGVEHDSEEYEIGIEHTEFVEQWLDGPDADKWPFIVETEKTGKYGRYLARVEHKASGRVLNDEIVEKYSATEV